MNKAVNGMINSHGCGFFFLGGKTYLQFDRKIFELGLHRQKHFSLGLSNMSKMQVV